jgi:hypothetical protein
MQAEVACIPLAPNHEGEVWDDAMHGQSHDIVIMGTHRDGLIFLALGHVARQVLAPLP